MKLTRPHLVDGTTHSTRIPLGTRQPHMATTFLILSDTHDDAFPDPASLPSSRVDVVLHCGDLTMIGGLSNYKEAIANLKAIDAELKLVIAGNHVSATPIELESFL